MMEDSHTGFTEAEILIVLEYYSSRVYEIVPL